MIFLLFSKFEMLQSVGRWVRDLLLEVTRPGNGSDAVVLEHLHIVVDSSAPEVD